VNRLNRGWLAASIAYTAVIFFVSSQPYLRTPGPEFDLKDNLAHALEYGVLGVLLARALGFALVRDALVTVLLVVAIGAGVGATDEMYQGSVPGRRTDVADWASDASGAALGAVVMVSRARKTRRFEASRS
jgi:VanZ family protein